MNLFQRLRCPKKVPIRGCAQWFPILLFSVRAARKVHSFPIRITTRINLIAFRGVTIFYHSSFSLHQVQPVVGL